MRGNKENSTKITLNQVIRGEHALQELIKDKTEEFSNLQKAFLKQEYNLVCGNVCSMGKDMGVLADIVIINSKSIKLRFLRISKSNKVTNIYRYCLVENTKKLAESYDEYLATLKES